MKPTWQMANRCVLWSGTRFVLLFVTYVGIASDHNLFDRLLGEWNGTGKSFGMAASPKITWERVLGDQYVRILYRSEIRDSAGMIQTFEGHAYYNTKDGSNFTATWFDSQGESHPIRAESKGDTLIATWGTESTKLGRTFYLLRGKGTLEVWDTVRKKNGSWHEFSRAILHRK